MKNKLFLLTLCFVSISTLSVARSENPISGGNNIQITIDLVNINNDRVMVTAKPGKLVEETVTYQLPRIIPGTYAIADYGRYVDNFRAYDKNGDTLAVTKLDVNTWQIRKASKLQKVTYWVNDTFDSESGSAFAEGSETIFSPAGTNILEGKQFMLNMAGFVGYFENQKTLPYYVSISHPQNLVGSSSMDDQDTTIGSDLFITSDYAALIDSPVMYAAPDIAEFSIQDMKVILHVYSPNNTNITAKALLPDLQKMMTAQKEFLGKINTTKKYAILVYISRTGATDANGIGALEHNSSTTAVFLETMKSEDLIHVISHEFFHTLTPLKVHSKEIHYFDFNNPSMSKHLWFYEGITEYFSQMFQVNKGLVTEENFLKAMALKEIRSKNNFPDSVSFTEMSKNVLDPNVKKLYPNVYEKGALLAMCIDIIIRSKSNGEKGIIDMMGQLSEIYGPEKPFDDDELISVITQITYPEVGAFIQEHIVKGTPVNYLQILELAGVGPSTIKIPVDIALVVGDTPYLKIDREKNEAVIMAGDGNNVFIKSMGLQDNDVLVKIGDNVIDPQNMLSVLVPLYKLTDGTPMTINVIRDGKPLELKGVIEINKIDLPGYKFVNPSLETIKNRWLKG